MTQLKTQLVSDFGDKLPSLPDIECGYLDKSSKRWIEDNRDLEAMYKAATIGDEITIWCKARKEEQSGETSVPRIGRKRKSADSDGDDALPAK